MNGGKIDPNLNLHSDIIAKAYDGDPSAQLEVGKAYYQNTGIEGNYYQAFKWIESSSNQGDKEALFRLADMYALGHGVDQNILYAHELYTDSALQDYPKALIRIHNLYQEDKKIHCRGELDSEEEGMNELEFKKINNVRELNEYRLNLMQSKNLLGNTIEFYSRMFETLTESNSKDKDIQRKIGFLYQYGYGIRKIPKQAIQWYTEAAEQGHISAQYNLGLLYEENTEIKFNYRSAFKWYTLAANGGHSMAQNRLAYFYEKGIAVELDISKALDWYKQAAVNNNKGAMLNIARINRKGLVGDQNIPQSIKWYQKAAKQGSATAKNCLYLLSQRELNPDTKEDLIGNESSVRNLLCSRLRSDALNQSNSPDFNKLEKLVSHASVGDGNSMLEVGFKYLNGENFTEDKEVGFKWIQKAANTGLAKAQLIIADMYEEGKTDIFQQDYYDDHPTVKSIKEAKNDVIKQDYYEATIWYSLAAKKKDKVAQYKLGMMYYVGHGLRKDPLEASRWFTWSAEQGNSDAQYMLGLQRLEGNGLTRSESEALEWLVKSAYQENSHALYQLGKIIMDAGSFTDKDVLQIIPSVKVPRNTNYKYKSDTFYSDGTSFSNEIFLDYNLNRAITFCEHAAKKEDIDAQLLLAEMHENDFISNKKNLKQALEYYLSAAKNGNLEAKYKAGWMYLNGTGTDRNDVVAFQLIKEAADNNYPEAKSLFDVSIKIQSSTIDYSKVLEMFQIVTENGLASLEYNIGYLYENGLGDSDSSNAIEINDFTALHWYKKAEQKNHPKALYRLGVMNQEGKGVSLNHNFAVHYYNKGSQLKDTESLNALASLYLLGIGVNKDVTKAFLLYFEAANLGHLGARSMLAPLYGIKEENKNKFMSRSIRNMWEQEASFGNTIMQYRLGEYYQTKEDVASTLKYFELAAQGGITNAYYKMGIIYEKEGENQDYSKALEFYQKAANKNHDKAIYRMAEIYLHGLGVSQDYGRIFQLYNRAAELGNNSARELLDLKRSYKVIEELEAFLPMFEYIATQGNTDIQYDLGYLYEKILKPSNYKRAVEWYYMAEVSSHREATYRLGRLYKYGLGIDQDWRKATEYLEKAMKLNSGGAYFEMGEMYHKGTGVELNISKAKTSYLKAAELDDSDAEFTLGMLYEEGKFVAKNILVALEWYTKAYTQLNTNGIDRLADLDEETYYKNVFERKQFSIYQWITRCCTTQLIGQNPKYYGNIHYLLGQIYFNRIKKGTGNRRTMHNVTRFYYNDRSATSDEENACECFNIAYKIYNSKETIAFIIQKIQDIITSQRTDDHQYLKIFQYLDGKLLFDIGNAYYNGTIQNSTGETFLLEPDHKVAFKLFNESSKKSHCAEKMLGDMYYYGDGVNIDYIQGVKHHAKYASTQNREENLQIANKYYESTTHVSENESIAFIYLFKAEFQRSPSALNHSKTLQSSDENGYSYTKRNLELHKVFAEQQTSSENIDIGFLYSQGTEEVEKNNSIADIYFKAVEKRDDPIAKRYLGDEYSRKDSDKYNLSKAKEFYIVSATELGEQECFDIGLEYYEGAMYVKKNPLVASIYFSEAYKKGIYNAPKNLTHENNCGKVQRYLGDLYLYGDGVKQDYQKAEGFYESSANWLSKSKNYDFGQMYSDGSGGVKKNIKVATIYLTKAMKQGHPDAGKTLGDMHYHEYTSRRNDTLTREETMELYQLYQSSANLFSGEKNYYVGQEYLNKSNKTAISILVATMYLTKAAEQGYFKAGKELGDMYCYGNGVEKDQEKATKYYKLSADSFSRDQNYQTGQIYFNGHNGAKKNIETAFIYFAEAAERGHPIARRYMGDIYYHGNSVKRDYKKAMEFYQASANGLQRNENNDIGMEYIQKLKERPGDISIAMVYLNKAADQGYFEAGRYLGDMYYYGEIVGKDHDKAKRFYRSSINGLFPDESYRIGLKYLYGSDNVKKSTPIAYIYLSRADEQGYTGAKRNIADMYFYGDGVEKDQKKAIDLYQLYADSLSGIQNYQIGQTYRNGSKNIKKNIEIALIYLTKAIEQDFPDAGRYLGDMYYYGNDIKQDKEKAIQFYQFSANRFSKSLNFDIGKSYFHGLEGAGKNTSAACVYFTKAAEQGYHEAERYLGDIYYYGDGFRKDLEKAQKNYQSSADRLLKNQNYTIGKNYLNGSNGVSKNPSIAYIYLFKAAEQGHPEAKRCIADMHYYGNGTKKDHQKASDFYRSSANSLLENQNLLIGLEYLRGSKGVLRNAFGAHIYFMRAAEQGQHEAERYLGDIFYYGIGVEKDIKKASDFYQSFANSLLKNQNLLIGLEYLYGSRSVNKNASVALIYLTKAAEQEQHEAERYLGDMYYDGNGVEKDQEKAVELYQSSTNGLSSNQNFNIGQEYLHGSDNVTKSASKNVNKNASVALIYLTKAAEQGQHEAERYLGDMYYGGNGVGKNQEKAMELYQLSANGLSNNQNFTIGQKYLNTTKNASIAYIYLSKAVQQEQHEAKRYLADIYYHGNGVEKDLDKAMKLYQSSANNLSNNRNFNIGRVYLDGSIDVIKNASVAYVYLSKAAEQEQYEAKRYLGDMYYYGESVEKNLARAMMFYQSSANGLLPKESYRIGLEYLDGRGAIKKNVSIAYVFFLKAADQGHPHAKRNIADMYYDGDVVEKNVNKAMDLYHSSAKGLSYLLNFSFCRGYLHGYDGFKKNLSIALIYFNETVEQGNHEAEKYLGDIYYIGKDVEKSRKKAKQYYRSSANGSSPQENYDFGLKYLHGFREITKNTSISYIYLTKAAEQGHHGAERYLGDMYYYGECVREDREKAIELYQSSSSGLFSEENYRIGQAYLNGSRNTKKDDSIANIYLTKAAEQGHPDAKNYVNELKGDKTKK